MDRNRVTISDKVLGKGSYGSVNTGTMVHQGKRIQIAIKKIPNDGDHYTANARKEYGNLVSIGEHVNIIKLLGFHSDRHYMYILMELGSHGDLEQYLQKANPDIGVKIGIMHNCANGLKFMHSRPAPIAHRDIKPGNVIIHNSAEGGIIAKMAFMSTDTGTIMYRAPEFFSSDKIQYTISVDNFALGLVFLVLLLYSDEEKCLEPNPSKCLTFNVNKQSCSVEYSIILLGCKWVPIWVGLFQLQIASKIDLFCFYCK